MSILINKNGVNRKIYTQLIIYLINNEIRNLNAMRKKLLINEFL